MTLKPYQAEHRNALQHILRHFSSAVDTSVMGSGKTYTTCSLAAAMGLPLMVVCPAPIVEKWVHVAGLFGVPLVGAVSFESLRSVSSLPKSSDRPTKLTVASELKHGFLLRTDMADAGKTQVLFEATDKWTSAVKEGVLLVADECHRSKNYSDQSLALHALTKTIISDSARSKILFLSGTPFDKKQHASHLLQLLFSTDDEVYNYMDKQAYLTAGSNKIVKMCMTLDPVATQAAMDATTYESSTWEEHFTATLASVSNVALFMYELFRNVLQPAVVRAMPNPRIEVPMKCFNSHYILAPADVAKLTDGVIALSRAAYDVRPDVQREAFNLGAITLALQAIEVAKVPLFIRLAREALRTPNVKVILGFSFFEALDPVMEALKEFSPLLLCGASRRTGESISKRIAKFQQPDGAYRLICGIMSAMKEGIDLHDTDGRFPRVVFANTSHKLLDAHQFAHRFYRIGTLSSPTINFVYSRDVDEYSVNQAMFLKTEVCRDILPSQVANGTLFPALYPDWVEQGPQHAEPCKSLLKVGAKEEVISLKRSRPEASLSAFTPVGVSPVSSAASFHKSPVPRSPDAKPEDDFYDSGTESDSSGATIVADDSEPLLKTFMKSRVPVQPTLKPRPPIQPTPKTPVQPALKPRAPIQPTPKTPVQPTLKPRAPLQPSAAASPATDTTEMSSDGMNSAPTKRVRVMPASVTWAEPPVNLYVAPSAALPSRPPVNLYTAPSAAPPSRPPINLYTAPSAALPSHPPVQFPDTTKPLPVVAPSPAPAPASAACISPFAAIPPPSISVLDARKVFLDHMALAVDESVCHCFHCSMWLKSMWLKHAHRS